MVIVAMRNKSKTQGRAQQNSITSSYLGGKVTPVGNSAFVIIGRRSWPGGDPEGQDCKLSGGRTASHLVTGELSNQNVHKEN